MSNYKDCHKWTRTDQEWNPHSLNIIHKYNGN